MERTYLVELIAWITDDGPDGKKARRRIRELMKHIIETVCWTHQNQLIVGDYLSLTEYNDVILQALDVVKWFNNHGTALSLFNAEQVTTAQSKGIASFRPLALILPVITRWTAHYLSVCRLLEVKDSIRTCVVRSEGTLIHCAGGI